MSAGRLAEVRGLFAAWRPGAPLAVAAVVASAAATAFEGFGVVMLLPFLQRVLQGGPEPLTLPLRARALEQWLNGLVYELFFPDELHARNLKLFDETARLNPPDLAQVPDPRKLAALQEVFTKAYDANATLRGMLFDLRSLDVVRVIEDVSGSKTEPPVKGEA